MAKASNKKILVVDDEPDVRNFLSTCIEDAGFNVDTAVDGVDALEKIKENPPDLVTLDMVMPRKTGIQLLRDLRNIDKMKNLPVIIITAHANDEFGSEDMKSFNAFTSGLRPRYTMEKPITPEKLVKAIGDILSVDIEEADQETPITEEDKIMRLLKGRDQNTLKKIEEMLTTTTS